MNQATLNQATLSFSRLARFFQLISESVEFLGIQKVIIFPIAQDMLENDKIRMGSYQKFCPGNCANWVCKAITKQYSVLC